MTNGLVEKGDLLIAYNAFKDVPAGSNYRGKHFRDCSGDKQSFKDCVFNGCVFERSYFHAANFRNCSFIGCKFIDCNFREAQFSRCKFEFTQWRNTWLEPDQMLANLPEWPNARRDFLRALRVNAASTGTVEAVRKFVREELRAEREHLRQAREARSGYYYDHYRGFRAQAKIRVKSFAHFLDRWVWGHGEYPLQLAIACLLFLLLLTLLVWTATGFQGFGAACFRVFGAFLGLSLSDVPVQPSYVEVVATLVRFLFIGLFVATIGKLISRR